MVLMDIIEPAGLELLEEYARAAAEQNLIHAVGPGRWRVAEGVSLEDVETAVAMMIVARYDE